MRLLGGVALLVLLMVVGVASLRVRRQRRAAEALRRDEEDFELRFPEGPADRTARVTVVGRKIRNGPSS